MVHLYQSLINTVKFGYQSKIIEDSLSNSVSNLGLIYKSILLGNILLRFLINNEDRPIGLFTAKYSANSNSIFFYSIFG